MKDQTWMMIGPLVITSFGAGVVGRVLIRRERAEKRRKGRLNQLGGINDWSGLPSPKSSCFSDNR